MQEEHYKIKNAEKIPYKKMETSYDNVVTKDQYNSNDQLIRQKTTVDTSYI